MREFLFTVLLTSLFVNSYGQLVSESSPADKVSNYYTQNFQEKVHITTDRSFYTTEDTVWFAGYVVNSKQNIPTDHSKLLYVDIIDERNEIVSSYQLPLDFGYTSGYIPLPSTFDEGYYCLRAYTNWMRNYDTSFFFRTRIFVFNPREKQDNKNLNTAPAININTDHLPVNSRKYDVQLFPESGNLVNGLKSKIGIKITNSQGLGANATIKIMDGDKNIITDYKTLHAGMGSFEFTPDIKKKYAAVVDFHDGTKEEISIPKIETSGYVLVANNDDQDSLKITLRATDDLINGAKIFFVPMSNGFPLFYMETRFPDQTINITIPKSKAPGGILQLYLLNEKLKPVAQRLVFNNYYKAVNLSVENLKKSYSLNEKVEFNLNATDMFGKPVMGSFSASVTNLHKLPEKYTLSTTILSNLLLCSDIKGFIENPNYYFEDSGSETRNRLDNLMLTQGWTRFSWSDLSDSKYGTKKYPVENKIAINGTISGLTKASARNVPLTLLAGEIIDANIFNVRTDSLGRFSFTIADSLKYLPIRLQVKDKREYKIIVDKYQPPSARADNLLNFPNQNIFQFDKNASELHRINANNTDEILASGSAINLKDIEVKGARKVLLSKTSISSNLNGPG